MDRKRASPVGISGIIVIAVVCGGALLWRLGSQSEVPAEAARAVPPETTVAQPTRTGLALTATVGYNRNLRIFRVANGDAFAWTDCQLSLNAQGVSSGYMRTIATIEPGITTAALIESGEFVDAEGRAFDPANQQVTTLDLACETPQGHRAYGGRF